MFARIGKTKANLEVRAKSKWWIAGNEEGKSSHTRPYAMHR